MAGRAKKNTLTDQQQVFVEHYLFCWNATEAARHAGYAHPNAQGSRLLVNVSIAAKIAARLAEKAMAADEVMARLADVARGDLADFVDVTDPTADLDEATDILDAKAKAGGWRLNLGKAEQRGKLHLLKKLKSGQWGPEIELHDPVSALVQIGKHHALFVERTEHTGKDGGPLDITTPALDQAAKELAAWREQMSTQLNTLNAALTPPTPVIPTASLTTRKDTE